MPDAPQPTPSKPPKRDPAFPLYADDFLSGTAEMSAEEVGAYIRLLCHQWAKGGLPNDEPRLARMAGLIGSPSLGYVVAKFRPYPDGCLRHPRLEAIRAEREAFKARQANSGAVGAERRWGKKPKDGDPNGDPNGKPMATPMAKTWPEDGSPSPSPSPNIPPIAPQGGQDAPDSPAATPKPDPEPTPKPKRQRAKVPLIPADGFDTFWAAYPAKLAKTAAIRAWNAITPDAALADRIVADVQARRNSHDWTKDMGQFIPHPSTYLNQRRWEDMRETLAPVAAPGERKPVGQMTEQEILEWATR